MREPDEPRLRILESGAVYFRAVDSTVVRVYDIAYGPPLARPWQRRRFDPVGPPECGYRMFVARDAAPGDLLRQYMFAPSESRELIVEALERQFHSAAWTPRRLVLPQGGTDPR